VSRICEAIKDEFDTWKNRDLSGTEVDYFFADGSYFRMHPGAPPEPVLVAWGITSAGKPVFLGMEPGSSESHDAWAGFFRGLTARGLRHPLLVVSDGGKGLIGAAEIVFEHSLRQRCLIHRARNILTKVPVHAQAQVKVEYWKIFDDVDAEPGTAAQAFHMHDQGDGYVSLMNVNSGKCVDVADGGASGDGVNILQWSCHGGHNQQWLLQPL